MNSTALQSGSIVNIAAYKFVTLDDLPQRRRRYKALCLELGLKGTILLSPEGINLFLAGTRAAMDHLLNELKSDPLLTDLIVKESYSEYQPFDEMLVKLKREIIAFGVEGIDPRLQTSPRCSPQELKQWLDEGRPITLLDTRNGFEVAMGTFTGAMHLNIGHFRDFPKAVQSLPDTMKQQPVVVFCTGGIRCEKAGPLLEKAGFQQVIQLDGGILRYLEECGTAHWEGNCFVFDQRVALDGNLQALVPENRSSP